MERKLVMTFKDRKENKFNLTINDVKETVTLDEIKALMEEVMTTGAIQSDNGELIAKLYAVVVDTNETKYNVL